MKLQEKFDSRITEALAVAPEFKDIFGVIHTFIGGSELHGAKVKDTDDLDIYGLYIEAPERILGLENHEHYVWSTAGNERRNGPEDIDLTFYSLRKWASMAVKGNPTALHFLFAYNLCTPGLMWGELVSQFKKAMLAKTASKQFMGFVDAQMGRLLGTRGRGKKGQRPELECEFGYDVKAGMHAVRLLHECIELMRIHTITLPRPEKETLIEIRTGKWSLDRLSSEVNKLFVELKDTVERSTLQETPDRAMVSKLLSQAYMTFWSGYSFATSSFGG